MIPQQIYSHPPPNMERRDRETYVSVYIRWGKTSVALQTANQRLFIDCNSKFNQGSRRMLNVGTKSTIHFCIFKLTNTEYFNRCEMGCEFVMPQKYMDTYADCTIVTAVNKTGRF